MTGDAFENAALVRQHFTGRISAEVFDPRISNRRKLLHSGYEIRVYLNDFLQEGVITADPEQGFVQRWLGMKSDVRRGSVSIRIIKGSPSSDV